MKQEKQAVLFNTTCHSLGRSREFSADLTNKEEAPNKDASGAALRSGFTLIELLVVVLIIGILAAVALPQYRVAVLKSRLAAKIPTVKAMKEAAESYYLANGSYVDNIFDYDVEFPNCTTSVTQHCRSTDAWYDIITGNNFCPSKDVAVSLIDNEKVISQYGMCLDHSEKPGIRYCSASTANTPANQVCKSMGGVQSQTGKCLYTDSTGSCNFYVLP